MEQPVTALRLQWLVVQPLIIFSVKPTALLGKLGFTHFVAGFYLKAFICLKLWKNFAPQSWHSRVVVIPASFSENRERRCCFGKRLQEMENF